MAEFDAASKTPNTYTFSDFNTNGDNKIDKEDRKNSQISGEIWDALLDIKSEYDNAEDFEFAYEQVKFNLEAQKEMVGFRDKAKQKFGLNSERIKNEYNKFKNKTVSDHEAYTEDTKGKKLTFDKNCKNLNTKFKFDSMKSVLDDLEKGYEGGLVVGGGLKITYDKAQNSFVMTHNGSSKTLSKETLDNVLTKIASSDVTVTGYSKLYTVE